MCMRVCVLTFFLLLFLLTVGCPHHVQQVVTQSNSPQPATSNMAAGVTVGVTALKSGHHRAKLLLPLTNVVLQGGDLGMGLAQMEEQGGTTMIHIHGIQCLLGTSLPWQAVKSLD